MLMTMRVSTGVVLILHLLCVCQTTGRKHRGNRHRNNRRRLRYEDCGSDPNRPIHVIAVQANPAIIPSPGRLKLSVLLNVTRELPEAIGMDVSMSKYIFGVPFKIPCYKNIGTCHYKDVCGYLEERFSDGCPGPLARRGLPCTCPFSPGRYSMRRLLIRVPKMEGVLSTLAMGEYQGSVRLYDENSRDELGCLSVSFTMRWKKRRKGRLPLHKT